MKWFQLTEYACCTFVSIHLKVLTYISISSLFRLFASQYSGHLLLIFPHIYFSKPYALNQIHPKGFNWAPKKALKKPNMPKLADVLRGSAIGRAHGRENTISRGLVPWPWVQAVLDRAWNYLTLFRNNIISRDQESKQEFCKSPAMPWVKLLQLLSHSFSSYKFHFHVSSISGIHKT